MELNYLEDYWPCAIGLSVVDVISTQVARPDKLGTDPTAYDVIMNGRCRGNRKESRE